MNATRHWKALSLLALALLCTGQIVVAKSSETLIDDVTVIDGRGNPPVGHQYVLLQNGRIASIGSDRPAIR